MNQLAAASTEFGDLRLKSSSTLDHGLRLGYLYEIFTFARSHILARYLTFSRIKIMMGRVLPIYKWTSHSSISALNPIADAKELPNVKRYTRLLSELTSPLSRNLQRVFLKNPWTSASVPKPPRVIIWVQAWVNKCWLPFSGWKTSLFFLLS